MNVIPWPKSIKQAFTGQHAFKINQSINKIYNAAQGTHRRG